LVGRDFGGIGKKVVLFRVGMSYWETGRIGSELRSSCDLILRGKIRAGKKTAGRKSFKIIYA
jgi:hypothetical protein